MSAPNFSDLRTGLPKQPVSVLPLILKIWQFTKSEKTQKPWRRRSMGTKKKSWSHVPLRERNGGGDGNLVLLLGESHFLAELVNFTVNLDAGGQVCFLQKRRKDALKKGLRRPESTGGCRVTFAEKTNSKSSANVDPAWNRKRKHSNRRLKGQLIYRRFNFL